MKSENTNTCVFIILFYCAVANANNTSDSVDVRVDLKNAIFLNNTINVNLIVSNHTANLDVKNHPDFFIGEKCYFFTRPALCRIAEKGTILQLNTKSFFRFAFEGTECDFTEKKCTKIQFCNSIF